ncbi:hypothetical protein HZ326_15239, partial [Fusarium oxysporum f. sp. albedinis]
MVRDSKPVKKRICNGHSDVESRLELPLPLASMIHGPAPSKSPGYGNGKRHFIFILN